MIKIEFNGSGDEVRNEMLTLLGLQEPKVQIESPVNEKEKEAAAVQPEPVKVRRVRASRKPATPLEVGWTEKEAQRLLNQIKPNAKIIITELANKPEGYRKSDLIQTLGLKETAMRGQLSSIGNALKKMGKTLTPILRDKVDGVLTYRRQSCIVCCMTFFALLLTAGMKLMKNAPWLLFAPRGLNVYPRKSNVFSG